MGGNNLRIWTQHNYRFLDIRIISNKLRDAPVVHRALSYSVLFISQYPPPDRENSFCLEVSILDSGPIGLQLQSTYCHSGDPDVCVLALYRDCRGIVLRFRDLRVPNYHMLLVDDDKTLNKDQKKGRSTKFTVNSKKSDQAPNGNRARKITCRFPVLPKGGLCKKITKGIDVRSKGPGT
ncbi:hypothetical protein AVEN_44206-1 [Araneus ventricosus]|uniref:Uncharacterized protein n=1 Tax=Araneus ventricosus TaxID=182803 RepID=A0A4Y2S9N4_ARAVE|nr:hypothetical protein AVEN_44206-1 [Araneus ventricosus]